MGIIFSVRVDIGAFRESLNEYYILGKLLKCALKNNEFASKTPFDAMRRKGNIFYNQREKKRAITAYSLAIPVFPHGARSALCIRNLFFDA